MAVLIDTNVLLRAVQPSHRMHPVALPALERLLAGPEPLFIAIQNVGEFWNSATPPLAANGLGMTVDQVGREVKRLESFFEIVSESAASYVAWKTLATTHRVSGAQVHDARLAAVMTASGIARIVTFKRAGLAPVRGVAVLHVGQSIKDAAVKRPTYKFCVTPDYRKLRRRSVCLTQHRPGIPAGRAAQAGPLRDQGGRGTHHARAGCRRLWSRWTGGPPVPPSGASVGPAVAGFCWTCPGR
jgi:predicted nucleic acid-binding protein